MLSHPEQADRLVKSCPEAVPAAVVAGDPCYDRMQASLPQRARYRRAFGVSPEQRLILVSSTWGPRSLWGTHSNIVKKLLTELPVDEYRVAVALHPNVWHGHGPWQVRTWLADCVRAGLIVIPPREGWRAGLIAADCVVGDHGSVTFYGAALGRPVILAAFPSTDLDPASPVAQLGRTAPFLRPGQPVRRPIDQTILDFSPDRYADVTAATTSKPGESARLLRTIMYERLGLPEPSGRAYIPSIPVPPGSEGPGPEGPGPGASCLFVSITAGPEDKNRFAVRRWPAELSEPDSEFHLMVDETTPDTRALDLADVVTGRAGRHVDSPRAWIRDTFDRRPGCVVAGVETGPGSSLAGLRLTAAPVVLAACRTSPPDSSLDVGIHASLLYHWLCSHPDVETAGRVRSELDAHRFDILVGTTALSVEVTLIDPDQPAEVGTGFS